MAYIIPVLSIGSIPSVTGFNNALVGSGGITLSQSQVGVSNTIYIQGAPLVAISASNTYVQAGTVTFGNSNGVSFMISAGSVVASFSQSFQPVGSFGVSNLGNTSGNTGTVANQMILAGGNNITLSQATNTDGITVTISAPNQTNQTLGLYAASNTTQNSSTTLDARSLTIQGAGIISAGYSNGSIIISATSVGGGAALKGSGTYTQSTGTVEFANSNGITFGLSNNGTMTASHNGITSQSNQNISLYGLGNTTQNSSTVLNASNLSFNGLGIASVGYSNGSIQISVPAGVPSPVNFSAGTTSANLGSVVFNNANNITFGLDAGTITASYQEPIQSYYNNGLKYQGTTGLNLSTNFNFFQPFLLPYNISASYIRVPNIWLFGSTSFATTANNSFTFRQTGSVYANIYTKGIGASSKSLQYLTGGSVSYVYQVRAEIGAASNNQTVSFNFTYPSSEGNAQGNYTLTYNNNSTACNIFTTVLTSFNGWRYLDIPFAASLSLGDYWIAFVQSSSTATTGGAVVTGVTARNSYVGISQVSTNIALMGVSSNMSTAPMFNGLGVYSTNIISSSSVGLSNISTVNNQPIIPFQIIREA